MGFGLSFGAKKQSSTTNSTINKDSTTDVDQTQGVKSSQTGTQTGSTTGTSSQTGSTTGTSQQTNSTTGTQTQTGTTTTLDSDVSAALSERVKALLSGGVTDANIADLSNQIAGRTSSFNANDYIESSVSAAKAAGQTALQEQQSQYNSNIGGTAGTNSMAALLAQRGQNDLTTTLAKVRNEATATAQGIANQNLTTATGAQGALTDMISGLTSQLKGATTTTDTQTLTDEIAKLLGQTTGTSSQTGQTSEQTAQTTQQLLDQLTTLLGTTNESTTAVENSKTKGKSSGGGMSLAI